MRSALIEEKLDALGRCVLRIEAKRPATAEALRTDLDAQDIVALNLERAVQQCVDIALHLLSDLDTPVPATMSEAFEMLREREMVSSEVCEQMIKAVGMRNIAVHAYRKIDWDIVWNVATHHLVDFKAFAREVSVE